MRRARRPGLAVRPRTLRLRAAGARGIVRAGRTTTARPAHPRLPAAMSRLDRSVRAAALALAVLAPVGARAQGAAASAPAAAMRAAVLMQLEDAEQKFVALAEATPADKYAYRPAENVRTAAQVFVHIAGGNYGIPRMAGAAPAPGVTWARDAERTMTDKAQIVAALRASFAYVKQAVASVPEAELGAPVNLFGRPSTKAGVLVLLATHAHEHLGQAIAYARGSGVVPPWSRGGDGD